MPTRRLGKTGAAVGAVGLGTWQLGGGEWGEVDEHDAMALMRRAVDLGVNLFDTADVYGGGRSERLIGRFLKESRAPVHIATKLGRRQDSAHGWPENFSLEAARRQTQDSLERLGTDRLFLTQWHCIPTDVMRDGEVFEHLETIKREGLIANWGVSVESVEEALICLEHPGCSVLQVIFNVFRQKVASELLPAAAEKGVGILARVPLASGLLTGKFQRDHEFDPKDHRAFNADGACFNVGETFAGLPFEKGVELAAGMAEILGSHHPLAQLALRWILDHEAVSAVIPGATKITQVESNCASAALPLLPEAVMNQLRDFYEKQVAQHIRGVY